MKKLLLLLLVAAVAMPTTMAKKTASELAKEQRELRQELKKNMDEVKPSKASKNQAKKDTKAGWLVPAGARPLEYQYEVRALMEEEVMEDQYHNIVSRYIIMPFTATGKTYNIAFAAARFNAQREIANAIKAEVVTYERGAIEHDQVDATAALGDEQLNQRSASIAEQCLTMVVPIVVKYQKDDTTYTVDAAFAFDKMELLNKLTEEKNAELKSQGDQLDQYIDDFLKK